MDTRSDEREAESSAERTAQAFQEAQEAFIGVAEEAGIRDEGDVVALVKQVRSQRS